MTQSLCLNCGKFKFGAFSTCENCGVAPFDSELSAALTDHNLTHEELELIAEAIKIISETIKEQDKRYFVLSNYLSRKWSKILDFEAGSVNKEIMNFIDDHYNKYLAHLSGQETSSLNLTYYDKNYWYNAINTEMQMEDEEWNRGVNNVILKGLNIAKEIVGLKIALGEGALFQRFYHIIYSFFKSVQYKVLADKADQLIIEVKEYERFVNRYSSTVKRGFSGLTKQRASYLNGTSLRIMEMAKSCQKISYYKAGLLELIPLDFRRIKQEFRLSYQMYIKLVDVISNPHKIEITLIND